MESSSDTQPPTTFTPQGVAVMLGRQTSDVVDAQSAATARAMEPNDWIEELDDPVEKLLWMLLLQYPEVTVNAEENSVSGVDRKNKTFIDLYTEAATTNKDLIPVLQYAST